MYFTFACSGVPMLAPVLGQVLLPFSPTSGERLIPNQLDSKTRNIPQTAPVIRSRVDKVRLTNEQMEEFDRIVKKCMDGSISSEEAILQLRAGGIEDWVGAFRILIAIIMVLNKVDDFQVPPAPGTIVPPHLAWLYATWKSFRLWERGWSKKYHSYRSYTKFWFRKETTIKWLIELYRCYERIKKSK